MLFKKKEIIKEQEELIDSLKVTINSLEEDLEKTKSKLRVEQINNTKILKNEKKLKSKIKEMEYNMELLYNNLSPQKKKLVRPENQN